MYSEVFGATFFGLSAFIVRIETDAGSGYKKNIEDFINNYCFGAKREADRKYISEWWMKFEGINPFQVKFL